MQVVQHLTEADFILCHGTEALAQQNSEPVDMSLADMKKLLHDCSKQTKPIPMIVANPDVVTVSGDSLIPMPGTLAEYYAGLGGQVCAFYCPADSLELVPLAGRNFRCL